MRPSGGLAIVLLAATSLVAACSPGAVASAIDAAAGDSAGASAAVGGGTAGMTADQLCQLLTTSEIQAATGVAVGAGVPEGVNAPSCTWQGDGGALTLAWEEPSSVGTITPALQGDSAVSLVALGGVGDAAFYTVDGQLVANLDVSKASNALSVSVGFSPPQTIAKIESAEKQLALDALGRM
jgi:hypothetical protein